MTLWSDQIEMDLKWWEAELASLKLLAVTAPKDSDKQRALLRALWTMLYAHYEGFYKFCWELLLNEIERRNCVRGAAMESLVILSLAPVFRRGRSDASPSGMYNFYKTVLPNELAAEMKFSDRLDTQSNLWRSLAKSNNALVGISCPHIENSEGQLKALVGRRNEIAHGQKLVVESLDEYSKFEKTVMVVLHELAVEIVDYLDKKKVSSAGCSRKSLNNSPIYSP